MYRKNTKLKICNTIRRPGIRHAAKTMILTKKNQEKPRKKNSEINSEDRKLIQTKNKFRA